MTEPSTTREPPPSGEDDRMLRKFSLSRWNESGNYVYVFGLPFLVFVISLGAFYWKTRTDGIRSAAQADSAASKRLPVMFALPDFSLTERNEETVTLGSLSGKVWVANFIFTNCGGPCPIMTSKIEKLQETFADADDLRLVTITVDPHRDTPERLRQYADAFHAHPQRWLFLTGERDALFNLSIKGFKLAASDDPDLNMEDDHPIVHSTRFALVDRRGRIRGYYDGMDDKKVQQLNVDIPRLLAENASP